MGTVLFIGGGIGVFIEVAVVIAVVTVADSGHIGEEPFATFWYFVPLLCVSVAAVWYAPRFRKTALFNAWVASFGIALVVLLDTTNMLVQYDRWAHRGLPEPGTVVWLE